MKTISKDAQVGYDNNKKSHNFRPIEHRFHNPLANWSTGFLHSWPIEIQICLSLKVISKDLKFGYDKNKKSHNSRPIGTPLPYPSSQLEHRLLNTGPIGTQLALS
jgi:hypothetical protein